MKLIFKQRIFSWFDSYDIYDENGNTIFVVKGQLAWGHRLKIFNSLGEEVGEVREKIFSFLPKFEVLVAGKSVGFVKRKFAFFKPQYEMTGKNWRVKGDIWAWNYAVWDGVGQTVAMVTKKIWRLTDTYVLDVVNPQDALFVLALVLSIDAEKCSRGDD